MSWLVPAPAASIKTIHRRAVDGSFGDMARGNMLANA
jgi:hypothetical protein